MPRKPKNNGKEWTPSDNNQLKRFARRGTSTKTIAKKLYRTENAIYTQASKEKISLKPKD